MAETCKFCKKTFRDIYTLQRHAKTTKSCLKIQSDMEGKKTTCKICNKTYYSERELRAHKCNFYKEDLAKVIYDLQEDNKLLKEDVKFLKEQIGKKETKQPINLEPLKMSDVIDCHKSLNLEVIRRGVSGLVDFAYNYVFKNKILCTDFSRKKFVYKDENGDIKTDFYLQCLRIDFFSSILQHSRELVLRSKVEISHNISDAEEELIFDNWVFLQDIKEDIKFASQGQETPFVSAFVKLLAGKVGNQDGV